jgi:hypothetical protein
VIAYHSASIPVPKDFHEMAGYLVVALTGLLVYRLIKRV